MKRYSWSVMCGPMFAILCLVALRIGWSTASPPTQTMTTVAPVVTDYTPLPLPIPPEPRIDFDYSKGDGHPMVWDEQLTAITGLEMLAPVAVGAEVAKTITFEVPDTDFADIVEGLFYVCQREVDENGKNIHTDEDAVHNWLRLVLESTANRGLKTKARDQSVPKSVTGTVKRHDE